MQNVGVAWLMTSMRPTPIMVSLVQTAATLPVFLGALPAGAIADVVDRRRLLLLTQGWMLGVAGVRRRDGAIQWGLFHDTADPWRQVETFVVDSWADHLRQPERGTVADREIEARARAFHVGEAPPQISHLIFSYERESGI